jgi:xanthine dehydrogenase large subunit
MSRSGDAHESAAQHVSGEAKYTHDIALGIAGMLHAWPVQAKHAHARVVTLDTARAEAMPGVRAVLTARHVPGENDTGPVRHDEPLFPGEVMYHGQPVAWVIADSEDAARAAAAEVALEVEPLAAFTTMAAALEAESFLSDLLHIERGEPEAALSRAAHVLEGELEIGGQEHFYLETQAAYALREPNGDFLVHASTQHPSETQTIVARVLGVPLHRVTCEALRMGGAFGGKEVQANTFAAVAALGALVTGRPVSVRLDRLRDMTITGKRHGFLARYKVGFDAEGKLRALNAQLYSDGGYSLDLSEAVTYRAMFHIDNCYLVENLRVTGRVLRTHLPSNTAFRGFGGPQGMLVIEEVLDRVARALGLLPELVRERNFYRPGDKSHYGQEIRDAERIERIFRELTLECDFAGRRADIAAFNQREPHRKRGIAVTPVKFGISFTTTSLNQAGALVLVYRDGSVQVNHGGTEMGQGLHTKIRAVAARSLGVSPDAVRIMPTRTDKVPNTSATAASSGSDLNGAAVARACTEIRHELSRVAADTLGCSVEQLAFENGRISHGLRSIAFGEIVERAYLARRPLFAAAHYTTPHIWFDRARGHGEPFLYYAYGAAVSEVEVDTFTGQYELRRVDILHDVGHSLAPLIDLGQIEGGFAQGAGWLTCEELVFDEHGALRTSGASTYKLPGIGECPGVFNVRMLSRAGEERVIFGSKAVGEPPLMLAISVREALRDAIGAVCKGPIDLAIPATPEAVFWALHPDARRAQ